MCPELKLKLNLNLKLRERRKNSRKYGFLARSNVIELGEGVPKIWGTLWQFYDDMVANQLICLSVTSYNVILRACIVNVQHRHIIFNYFTGKGSTPACADLAAVRCSLFQAIFGSVVL